MSDAPEPHPAVAAVRARALAALKPGNQYAFATDPTTFAHGKTKQSVLIGIATSRGSIVMAIDMAEWVSVQDSPAEMILEFIGCTRPTAHELATVAKKVA